MVENGLDERSTVVGIVEHRDDGLPVGHVDLEGAHVAVSQGNCGCHLRFALPLGWTVHGIPNTGSTLILGQLAVRQVGEHRLPSRFTGHVDRRHLELDVVHHVAEEQPLGSSCVLQVGFDDGCQVVP